MANSILKFFQPKDRIFYNLFEQVVVTVEIMGKKLKEFVHCTDVTERAIIAESIAQLEHKNDETTHTIFLELGRNFITPFDREDVHYLASSLDDIADYIHASSKKIVLYNVDPNEHGIIKMAEMIEQACTAVKQAVMELRDKKNLKNITTSLIKINSIENQTDDIYDSSIELLFANEDDVKEVIKKREIYQILEIVTDKCEDASNVIESIIIKYA
jgi:uncharacterized protein